MGTGFRVFDCLIVLLISCELSISPVCLLSRDYRWELSVEIEPGTTDFLCMRFYVTFCAVPV